MDTGERIKARRNEMGLTLLELSQMIGVTEPTVQRYESGEIKNIKYEMLLKLAIALKVHPAYFFFGEENKLGTQSGDELILDKEETEFLKLWRLVPKERREVLEDLIIGDLKHKGLL